MAAIQERNGSYRILFHYASKQFGYTIGQVDRREAEVSAAQAELLLMRLNQGLISLSSDVDIVTFLRYAGRPPEKSIPTTPSLSATTVSDLTLGKRSPHSFHAHRLLRSRFSSSNFRNRSRVWACSVC